MKKIFAIILSILLYSSLAFGQTQTPQYTPNLKLYIAPYGQSGALWWPQFWNNMYILDTAYSHLAGISPIIYDYNYSTLAAADSAASSAGLQLVISQNWTLLGNTTLQSSVVRIPGGGFTQPAEGSYTLTFAGNFQNPDNDQCFFGFSARQIIGLRDAHAEWFPGGDIGARLSIAVTSASHVIVTIPGTISTAFDPPQGTTIDFATGSYTWTVSNPISHSNVILDFHGSFINTQVTGPVLDVGKLAAVTPGTVNTNGTTVTWVSGPQFSDLDPGDQIIINGSLFNLTQINSATQITVGSSAGTQSGVAYSAIMYPSFNSGLGNFMLPPRIINATFRHSSGTGDAIRATLAFGLQLSNITTTLTYTNGFNARGCELINVALISSGSPITITNYTAAGYSTGSNAITLDLNVSAVVGGSQAILVSYSGGIHFVNLIAQSNTSTQGVYLSNDTVVQVDHYYLEYNGDSSGNGSELYVLNSTDVHFGTGQMNGGSTASAYAAVINNSTVRFDNPSVSASGGAYASGAFYGANGSSISLSDYLISGCTAMSGGNFNFLKDNSGNLTLGGALSLGGALNLNSSYYGSRVKTTGVTSTATIIAAFNASTSELVAWVFGYDAGGDEFIDLIHIENGGTNYQLITHTVAGSPATRTYTNLSGNVKLAMGSGTYTIIVTPMSFAP